MRLAELQVALKRYGFNDTDPLTSWLNASLHEFEDSFRWPFLEAATTIRASANTATISTETLPSVFRRVIILKNLTNGSKLRFFPLIRFERQIPEPSEPGNAEIYTLLELNEITVWPIPQVPTEYRLVYHRSIPDLVTSEDVPSIPAQYHYTIVRGAAYIALQAENEEERAQTAGAGFQSDVNRAINFYSSHEDDELQTVEDVQGYGD